MSLESIITHYPIVEALVPNLTSRDFVHLTEVNSTFRKELKGLDPPANTTTITGSSLSTCSCRRLPEKCCPRHGTRRLRNLLRRTDRACQDACHIDRSAALADENSQCWMRTIRKELGGLSDAHPCWDCRRLVCFPCWWADNVGNYLNLRGGPRSQPVCKSCWKEELSELHEHHPQRFGSLLPNCASWSVAQERRQFCTCGPVVLCSTCSLKICATTETKNRTATSHGFLECRFCSSPLALYDKDPFGYTANFYCHYCVLPIRMQPLSSQHHGRLLTSLDLHVEQQDIPSLFYGRDPFLVRDTVSKRQRILLERQRRFAGSNQCLPYITPNGYYESKEEYWKARSRQWCSLVGLTDGNGKVGCSGASHNWVFFRSKFPYRPSPLAADYRPVPLCRNSQTVRWRRPPRKTTPLIPEHDEPSPNGDPAPFTTLRRKLKGWKERRPDSFGELVLTISVALLCVPFVLFERRMRRAPES